MKSRITQIRIHQFGDWVQIGIVRTANPGTRERVYSCTQARYERAAKLQEYSSGWSMMADYGLEFRPTKG